MKKKENKIKEILKKLKNVFKLMSENSIIHWDIKPENILIKKLENNKILYKLKDYGLLKQLTESQEDSYYIVFEKDIIRYNP